MEPGVRSVATLPVKQHALLLRLCQVFTARARVDPSLAAAWLRDSQSLLQRLLSDRARLQKCGPAAPAELTEYVSIWLHALSGLVREGAPLAPRTFTSCTSAPYHKPAWSPLDRPTTQAGVQHLTVASFGWWELTPVTDQNVRVLCQHLLTQGVQVCAVTGLAAGLAPGSLQGAHGYRWIGDLRRDCASAGFFVADGLEGQATAVPGCPEWSPRCRAMQLCGRCFQAVYHPHVGKWLASESHAFLRRVLDNHLTMQSLSSEGFALTMGDFNLRGVADDGSKGNSLRGISMPYGAQPRTERGGALDLHITALEYCGQVTPYWLPTSFADHALVLERPLTTQPPPAPQDTPQQCCSVWWAAEEATWEQACAPCHSHWHRYATVIRAASSHLRDGAASALREAVAGAAVSLLVAVLVTAGHLGGAVAMGRPAGTAGPGGALLSEQRAWLRQGSGPSSLKQWKVPKAHLRSAESRTVPKGFARAARGGPAALQRWLSSSLSTPAPRLLIDSRAKAQALLRFRAQVGRLDRRCNSSLDAAAAHSVNQLRTRKRSAVAAGLDPPAAVAAPADLGSSGFFVLPSTVQRLMRRRCAAKGSARLPVAALRGASRIPAAVEAVTSFLDLTWQVSELDALLLEVEVVHLYKGKGKDPEAIESYRPIGLVEPLLSLVVDVLQLRIGPFLIGLAGPAQTGGRCDPRGQVVVLREWSVARRNLGLPTCDLVMGARFGYDGGSHSQVLLQAHRAGTRPRDWLLLDALLRKHRLFVRIADPGRPASRLGPVEHTGGGMVQGVGISGMAYTLLPRHLEEAVAAVVPAPCLHRHPAALVAFKDAADGDLSPWRDFSIPDVLVRGERMRAALRTSLGGRLGRSAQAIVDELFRRCQSDAERLMLLDLSEQAVAAVHSYATNHGVVFQCDSDKNVVYVDGVPDAARSALQARLEGALQEGTPAVAQQVKNLGVLESAGISGAAAVLRQLERRAATLSSGINHRALQSQWPLAARRLFYARALMTVAFLLPLTIECSSAALRLNRLQSRWIHAVVHGPWRGRRPAPVGAVRKRYLADLGWGSLWSHAVISAILLHQKLGAQPPDYAHVRVVSDTQPPAGGWVSKVRHLVARFTVPPFADIVPEWESLPHSALKAKFRHYRLAEVAPRVREGLEKSVPGAALPWAWISANLSTPPWGEAFAAWWQRRCEYEPADARPAVFDDPVCPQDFYLKLSTYRFG
ncbi:unnamed protein product, partial [Prorocentrum cordatum]